MWVARRAARRGWRWRGKAARGASWCSRLENYMREKGLSSKGAAFYSHLLPSLETAAWKKNRVSGEGWLAVGDAAGLVDPITGEGLYYAIRSADLAAKALLCEIGNLTEKLQAYG